MSTDDRLERQLKNVRLQTTSNLDARILADAGAALEEHEDAVPSRYDEHVAKRPRSRRFAFVASAASMLALITMAAILFLGRPELTWAQVAEAMKSVPWVHLKFRLLDTEVEQWISLPKEIEATRQGKIVHFKDHRAGVAETYDADQNTIRRTTDLTGESRKSFLVFSNLFKELASGKETLDWSLPGAKVVGEKRRMVTENGSTWIDIELAIVEGEEKKEAGHSIVFRVDSKTRLLRRMTFTEEGVTTDKMIATIDYPESGPEDIYAIGVPRDAKVDDQRPTGDFKTIVERIKTAREQFDDCRAIQVWRLASEPWYRGTPMRLWYRREPAGKRLDYGFEYPDFKTGQPDPKVDRHVWWTEHSKKFWYVPHEVLNGAASYNNESKPEDFTLVNPPFRADPLKWPKPEWKKSKAFSGAAIPLPIYFAYPENLMRGGGAEAPRMNDVADKKDGLVTIDFGNEQKGTRYTVDSNRGFMVVRTDMTSVESSNTTVFSIIVDESARSPRGFWYPTLMRSSEQRDGKPAREDHVWQFYLDFDAKMPGSVFKPADHVITDTDELK